MRALTAVTMLIAGYAVTMSATAGESTPPAGPVGTALWDTVPTRLPANARRGDVLWTGERSDTPSTARGWNFVYVTEGADGGLEYASGELYVPRRAAAGQRRVVVWATGTAGFQDSCAPSRMPLYRADRSSRIPAIEPLLEAGYIVVTSDYQGLGVPGPTAYLNGPAQGKSVLDAVRAVAKFPNTNPHPEIALYGFSQGGQTVLWAAHLAPTYAPEFRVAGIVPIAPAARHLDLSLYDLGIPENAGYFISRMAGLAVGHPELRLRDVLTPAGLEMLPAMSWGCYEIFAAAGALKEPYAYREALEPGRPWRTLLEANDRFLPIPKSVPILLVQGDKDVDVPVHLTQELRRDLCRQGSGVDYRELAGIAHIDAVPPAAALLPRWLADRFAGTAAPSNCP